MMFILPWEALGLSVNQKIQKPVHNFPYAILILNETNEYMYKRGGTC